MYAQTPVLVVDDMAVMQGIIVRHLKMLGFSEIHVASNGQDALRQLELRNVKLVLSDWSMPGMSGYELLKAVRANPRTHSLPFVLVTGELHRGLVEQALQAGVNDFLLKPFSPAVLSEKLSTVLAGGVASAPARVPAPPAQSAPGPVDLAAGAPAAPLPTVLVVDDTPNNLTLVAGLLRDQYRVKLAVRGDKALALAAEAPPDLVLLDIMMPEMDGFEVCRRLKDNPHTAHVPVIFLSALAEVDKVVAGLAMGALDYVIKPIEPEILKARVANALRLSQAHEDLRAQLDLMVENARLREDVEQITRHDLRNPLSAILGMAQDLQDDPAVGEPARAKAKAIERAAYAMLDLSQFAGDLLKMERGGYQLPQQRIELAALLTRVADETIYAFKGKQVKVVTNLAPGGASVNGDALLLYSMLHNLARNAAEAVWQGETVTLGLAGGERVEIRVHNPGAVAPEVRERFFDKFASHGKEQGSGLGTYSARLIARAHGGDIAMQTDDDSGTTVSVTLPLA